MTLRRLFKFQHLQGVHGPAQNPGYDVHSICNHTELNGHIVLIDNLSIIMKTVIKNLQLK